MYTGVPEGGSISPTLFNLYIDPLANQLLRVGVRISLFGAIVYADDIILMAGRIRGLQKMLDICTVWADVNKITFGIEKSYALYEGKRRKLILAGQRLARKFQPYISELIYVAKVSCPQPLQTGST